MLSGSYDKTLPQILEKNKSHLRGNENLIAIRPKKDIRKYSFSLRVRKLWNDLPDSVINASDIEVFERKLDEYWSNQPLMYDDYKTEIKTQKQLAMEAGSNIKLLKKSVY